MSPLARKLRLFEAGYFLRSQQRPLGGEDFLEALFGQIDQLNQSRTRKGALFGRGLGFDKAAVGGHHHVHVHLGLNPPGTLRINRWELERDLGCRQWLTVRKLPRQQGVNSLDGLCQAVFRAHLCADC